MINPYELGASLYIPSLKPGLERIANGEKYPHLRSMIFCTEDSIGRSDLASALTNLRNAIPRFEPSTAHRFIRVRDCQTLEEVLSWRGMEQIAGFVLPKITLNNLYRYLSILGTKHDYALMLTLETHEVFDTLKMRELAQDLAEPEVRNSICALRIGGNDLLQILGLRRDRQRVAYDTILGHLIGTLVLIFNPLGFHLTAPVYEYLDQMHILQREVEQDICYGLIGKTAIHPEQVEVIERCYKVSLADKEMAESVLRNSDSGVFKLHNAMCEPATHLLWAKTILARERIYGLKDELRVYAGGGT